ncbi:NAD(P)-dependent oxidoreductase [Streptomyces asiaticus]|uniref:NAD(P)-dependent oxidoreductase n=1 Tax=Streptomyces asiaticus TaxID=114695 RepID=UPI0033F6AD4B
MLSLAKDFPGTWEHQRRREWRPSDSERIGNRTVLVWGTGSIGRAVAQLLRAVGMRVSGAGRTPRAADPDFRQSAPPARGPPPAQCGRQGPRLCDGRMRRPLTPPARQRPFHRSART